MPPLSEKARGKQRAVDAGPEGDLEIPAAPAPVHRDVRIRFSEGAHDLLLPVTAEETIKDIKAQVSSSQELERLKMY